MKRSDVRKAPSRGATPSTYPRDFFRDPQYAKERKRVFVMMPFEARHSASLYNSIAHVCDNYGFDARRADHALRPNLVVADILEELAKAEIVIADLTGGNPNVFYELGLAHVLFECERVILLAEKQQRLALPFDVSHIRCIPFNVEKPSIRERFEARLGHILAKLSEDRPTVIDSPLERTKVIVSDLERLASLPRWQLENEAVWFSGGLSAFAISRKERRPCKSRQEKEYYAEYERWLMMEKGALVELAHKGCPVYCIVTPPAKPFRRERLKYLNTRKETLLRFLQGADETLKGRQNALDLIKFAVSPYRQKNLYIIGHVSCIEGYKDEIQRGFALSLRQTTSEAINVNLELYRILFKRMADHTLRKYSDRDTDANLTEEARLRQATMRFLKRSVSVRLAVRPKANRRGRTKD